MRLELTWGPGLKWRLRPRFETEVEAGVETEVEAEVGTKVETEA